MKLLWRTGAFLCLFLLCVLWQAAHWPAGWWWLADLFHFLPLWPLLLPVSLLLLAAAIGRDGKAVLINGLSLIVLFVGVMGFNIPLSFVKLLGSSSTPSVRVLTANLGEGSDLNALARQVSASKPDIVALQEVHADDEQHLRRLFPKGEWFVDVQYHLAVISRFKIVRTEVLDRQLLGGWGYFVGEFQLESPVGLIHFFNVHLETPRKGIEELLDRQGTGLAGMRRVTELRDAESLMASKLASAGQNVMVAGDFNMLTASPIFRRHWSRWSDSFSAAGLGFGHTKLTRWFGVRIDHVLFDASWSALRAEVVSSLGGDHRPLISELSFVGTPQIEPPAPRTALDPSLLKSSLVSEDFESALGKFDNSEAAQIRLDSRTGGVRGTVMGVGLKPNLNYAAVGPQLEGWSLTRYPQLVFWYRVPAGTPLHLRVKTALGDWVYLGGSAGYVSPGPSVKEPVRLIDDGEWHELQLDARAAVQSVLPAIKTLKEFQFLIPINRRAGDCFWVDDFMIRESIGSPAVTPGI